MADREKQLETMLYRAVRELAYIHNVENCHSGLCKTGEGEWCIRNGMDILGIKDFGDDSSLKFGAPL